MRAEIVLLAADGMTNLAIAERLGITRVTAATWRRRFAAGRLDGLVDAPRPGIRASRGREDRRGGDDNAGDDAGRSDDWSTRSMAKATGVSISAVHRIWRAFSLQPHRSEAFTLSTDPLFVEKVRDIVGLYIDPAERALVLCVDEKRKSRRWIVPSCCCRCGRGRPSDVPMTISGVGRPRCLPPST